MFQRNVQFLKVVTSDLGYWKTVMFLDMWQVVGRIINLKASACSS